MINMRPIYVDDRSFTPSNPWQRQYFYNYQVYNPKIPKEQICLEINIPLEKRASAVRIVYDEYPYFSDDSKMKVWDPSYFLIFEVKTQLVPTDATLRATSAHLLARRGHATLLHLGSDCVTEAKQMAFRWLQEERGVKISHKDSKAIWPGPFDVF